jgi:tetratricopeptide (TPR) repeat protein
MLGEQSCPAERPMRIGRIALFTLTGIALASAVFAAIFALMPPNIIDDRPEEEICFDLEGSVTKSVPACTALIDSGRYSGNELANIYFERAMSFVSWGKIGRAIADFNEANRICPSSANHEWLGNIYEERGELDKALAEYNEMIRLEPERPGGYQRRADLWMKNGEYEKAIQDWSEAIRFEHPLTVVYEYSRRAAAHRLLGHEAESLADLDRAIESYPHASGAFNERAKIYEARGDRDKAIDDYRKALASQPYDPTAIEGLNRLGAKP